MLNRSKVLNYLTLILAIGTICTAVWSIIKNYSPIISIILMCITLIFNHMSRKINETETILTKDDKAVLGKIKNKSEEK